MDHKQIFLKIMSSSEEVFNNYANAKANYENLNEQKRVILAQLASTVEASSEAERRRSAECHPDYLEYLAGLAQANSEFRKAEARYNNLKVWLDCARSLNSAANTEAKL